MKLMEPMEEPSKALATKRSNENGKQIEDKLGQPSNALSSIFLRRESGANVIDLTPVPLKA